MFTQEGFFSWRCRIKQPLTHSLLTFSSKKSDICHWGYPFYWRNSSEWPRNPKEPFHPIWTSTQGQTPPTKLHSCYLSSEELYCKAIQNKVTITIGKKTLSSVEEEPRVRGMRTNMRSIFIKKLGKRETQDFLYICEGYLHMARSTLCLIDWHCGQK